MIAINEHAIKDIPCLLVTEEGRQEDALPTVIYFHGFTSAKEHNLPLAFLLAKRGFRVILPDAYLHGARGKLISEEEFQMSFWEVVLKNIEELELIKSYLDERELLFHDQIGVAGTSMGGITTSAALRKFAWIKAGAILMGAPKILDFAEELISVFEQEHGKEINKAEFEATFAELEKLDLAQDISSLAQRPLYLWHGDADQVVPFNYSYSFYKEAKKHYNNKGLLKFSREKGRDHKVSRPAILSTVNWFFKHLMKED